MAVRTKQDDDIFTEIYDGDGWRNQGCIWDESPCGTMPEYRIAPAEFSDHGEVQLLCPRHYALELARLVEVHLPDCTEPAAAHAASFGPIGS